MNKKKLGFRNVCLVLIPLFQSLRVKPWNRPWLFSLSHALLLIPWEIFLTLLSKYDTISPLQWARNNSPCSSFCHPSVGSQHSSQNNFFKTQVISCLLFCSNLPAASTSCKMKAKVLTMGYKGLHDLISHYLPVLISSNSSSLLHSCSSSFLAGPRTS